MAEVTIYKNPFEELIKERLRVDGFFRVRFKKKVAKNAKGLNDLLELAKLQIRGGPKNLSTKFDSYLYG